MVSIRGDGPTRSQQTRLGSALQRSGGRVFGELRIIRTRIPGDDKARMGFRPEDPNLRDDCFPEGDPVR